MVIIVKDQSSHLLVYLNMHKIIKGFVKFWAQFGHRSCEIIMKDKTPWSHKVVCFQMLDFVTSNSKTEVSNSWKITSFPKTTSLQRKAVSHRVLYYQPSPFTHDKVRFYANNCVEYLPIVFTAFKVEFVLWKVKIKGQIKINNYIIEVNPYTTIVIGSVITVWLKAVDTIGNCQKLVFTLGVSHHMHKITNLWAQSVIELAR